MFTLDLFIQQIATGLVIGIGYALVAVGLTLIFGILNVINFAHGEFYMLGAFIAFVFAQYLGFGYLASSLCGIAAVMVIAVIVEKLAIQVFMNRDPEMTLLSTFAVSLILMNMVEVFWGNTPLLLKSPLSTTINMGPITLTYQRITIMIMGVLFIIVLTLFLKFTLWGKIVRATAQNKTASQVVGINITAVYRLIFAVGAGIAALAGVLIAPLSNLYVHMGQGMCLKGFVIVVLGGLASIPGAIAGGVILGLLEAIAACYLSSAWKDVIGFSILILILMFRPQGLLGKKIAKV